MSKQFVKFIVPYHYTQAIEALEALKSVKNVVLQQEISKLITAWKGLKADYDNMDREDQLKGLKAKVNASAASKLGVGSPGLSRAHTSAVQ